MITYIYIYVNSIYLYELLATIYDAMYDGLGQFKPFPEGNKHPSNLIRTFQQNSCCLTVFFKIHLCFSGARMHNTLYFSDGLKPPTR